MSVLVAQFIATYGAGTFDRGHIPWAEFWMLFQEIPQLTAMARVNMTTAVSMGAGLVMGGDKVLAVAEQDRKDAYNFT